MTRILIAENQELMPLLALTLAKYDLVQVTNVSEAMRKTIGGCVDLFLISVHFHDSRSIELITGIRNSKEHQSTPIILLRVQPSSMEALLRHTAVALKSSRVINEYLEIEKFAEVPDRLNACVESLLAM